MTRSLAAAVLLALSALPAAAQGGPSPAIAWFGTLEEGIAEARRSGRPILLQSAAPQCHLVPGVW